MGVEQIDIITRVLRTEFPELDPDRLRTAVERAVARVASSSLDTEGYAVVDLHLAKVEATEESEERSKILRELSETLEGRNDCERALVVRISAFAEAPAQDDIAPLSREHRSAWNAEALLASSSDDVRMVHDAGIVRGSREIAATLRSGPLSLEPIGGGMSQSADLAYTYGRYACDGASGHYVHLWMRGPRGEWKLAMIVRP